LGIGIIPPVEMEEIKEGYIFIPIRIGLLDLLQKEEI
jgi:hypothetical protein